MLNLDKEPIEEVPEKQNIKEEFLNYQLPHYKQELISALNSNNDVFDLVEIFKYCARFYICQYYNNELKIEEHIPECVFKYFIIYICFTCLYNMIYTLIIDSF